MILTGQRLQRVHPVHEEFFKGGGISASLSIHSSWAGNERWIETRLGGSYLREVGAMDLFLDFRIPEESPRPTGSGSVGSDGRTLIWAVLSRRGVHDH